ncbi:MAG: ATP-binding protein [Lachnospiraceae bacterium]|jgi:AAA15 family ATPase/GTPase|nr:ATP-binding protein [Lachnospiraceae bacterium]
MLIDFKMKNFRSFKDMTEFSMETGRYIRKHKSNVIESKGMKLLKSAVLFGGNANGKTNLISALLMLQTLVLRPTAMDSQKLPMDTFAHKKGNTEFEISFIANKIIFDYQVIYNENEYVYECLKADNDIIFERKKQEFIFIPKQLELIKGNIRKNQNLLFFAQANNVSIAQTAILWFLNDIIYVNTEAIPNTMFSAINNKEFKAKYLRFLRAADFNIVDVEVREKKVPQFGLQIPFGVVEGTDNGTLNDQIAYRTVYEVYNTYKSENDTFPINFGQESSGTKAFMFLALYILHNENTGKLLLIDEFDRSLHIELAQALLDVFNNEKQCNQFLLTTHELSLMDYNLRQDQIWFAEKKQYGESELFSIYDFDDEALKRSDFGYKKRYLEGRFGASQIVNTSILLEVMEDSRNI